MYNDAEVINSNNTQSIFQFNEIDISDVTDYPVKILYEQKDISFGNIIIFDNKEALSKFIKLRKYMLDNIETSCRTPGKIRIFE